MLFLFHRCWQIFSTNFLLELNEPSNVFMSKQSFWKWPYFQLYNFATLNNEDSFSKLFTEPLKNMFFWFPLQKRPLYICSFIPNTTIGIYLYFHLIPFDLCIVCGLFTYYSNFSDTKSFQGAIIEGIFLPMLVKPNSVSFRILKNIQERIFY